MVFFSKSYCENISSAKTIKFFVENRQKSGETIRELMGRFYGE
jgi:hypothetical protein